MTLLSTLRSALGANRSGRPGAPEPVVPLASGRAPSVSGVTPSGDPIEVAPEEGGVSLLFLTSDCAECKSCWERPFDPADAVIIVTPDPATDSSRAVARLSPHGVPVVMSSASWHAYGVTKAPWMVTVNEGEVTGSRPAV